MILVTGANGFIGRAAVTALRKAGQPVRRAVRRPDDDASTVVIGDLGPTTDWARALDGCTAFLHTAAMVHQPGRDTPQRIAEFNRINAEGSAALARQAQAAGVGRIIHLSSIKVLGDVSGHKPFDARSVPVPPDAYGESKHLAEVAIDASGMAACHLRLPLVYGPGARGNMAKLFNWVAAGWPLPFGDLTRNRRSLIGIGNLSHALVRLVKLPAPLIGPQLIADDETPSTAGLIRAIATALNHKPRLIPVPEDVLRAAFLALGRKSLVERLLEDLVVDDSSFRARVGWTPPQSLAEGLAAMARMKS